MYSCGTVLPLQYNIIDFEAYVQYVIDNVESSSLQHHQWAPDQNKPAVNLITSVQLGSLEASLVGMKQPLLCRVISLPAVQCPDPTKTMANCSTGD
jgi:hypothetical protein